ncbi:MAG: hypothetical protein U9N87_12425, partial [Planctomycetota bacterium]|nr:hypothetical protein [Planctomycetota bacterium]
MCDETVYRIETPPPPRWVEALRLVFRDLPEEERIAQVQEHLDIHGDDDKSANPQEHKILLGAYRQDCLVAAVLAHIQAGRTAVAWPPRLADEEPPETAQTVLQALCEQLDRHDVSMVHILIETVTPSDDATLRQAGFEPLAKLLYMFCGRDDFPGARPQQSNPDEQLDFEPYDPS